MEGGCVLAPSFDVAGWFARDLSLFAKIGDVLLTNSSSWPKFDRVLIAEDAFGLVDPGVREAQKGALDRMATVLGKPQPVTLASEGLQQWFETFRTIQFSEIWREHADWIKQAKPKFGPGIAERVELASN
jgi:amidase